MAQGKSVRLAGNTATHWIKLLAVVLMLCDHAGKMLYGNCLELRILGRIAFPLYAWCMVVGASYTASMPRYLIRLVIMGVISQMLYMVALDHSWHEMNIFLTLSLGLLALWGMREKRLLSQIWAPVLAMAAAQWLGADYGWQGVMLMALLFAVRDSAAGIAAVMLAFCMYWGTGSQALVEPFGLSLAWARVRPWSALVSPWLRLQAMAILALPVMLLPMRHYKRLPRWIGYCAYPLHLVLLIVLEGVMTEGGFAQVAERFLTLVLRPALSLLGLG